MEQPATDEVQIRYTLPDDAKALREWFHEPNILRWFPHTENEMEIDDAVNRWIYYHRFRSSITAVVNGEVAGIATFYPHAYQKIKHQALLSIMVAPQHRNKKVGEKLMLHLFHLAKTQFNINLLHLEVYEGSPAIKFYKRLGFKEFGFQSHWVIEADGKPRGRHLMERFL